LIRRDGYVIWPAYFDASISRSMCRRVPLSLAVKNPTAEQIAAAARRLGWRFEVEQGSHPAMWWRKTGKVVVKPSERLGKNEVIRRLAAVLKTLQQR